MCTYLLLLACCIASTLAIYKPYYDITKAWDYFQTFKYDYSKTYTTFREELYHYDIFQKNLVKVNDLNTKNNITAFGITQFMDLHPEEIVREHTGLAQSDSSFCPMLTDNDIPDSDVPEVWDWRIKNVVTRVKDQGQCSSSWAFGAAGQMESVYAIKYGKLYELSEQQLIDCDPVSNGCCGGYAATPFIYLYNPAVESKYYPYEQTRLPYCYLYVPGAIGNPVRCRSYQLQSQEKVKQLLYQHGPITIAIKSSALVKHYIGGIITDEFCFDGELDHVALLVGYGVEDSVPYWIVKNSWGESFGEDGYFRIERGINTVSCGMLNVHMTTIDMTDLDH